MQPDWQRYINQQLGKPYHWEHFATGSSNKLFRGCFESDCIVLRQNGVTADTPGVSRERESLLLQLISPHCWAPNIIENRPNEGWCVMQRYSPLDTQQALETKPMPLNKSDHHSQQNQAKYESASVKPLNESLQGQLLKAMSDLQNITLKPTLENDTYPALKVDYQHTWNTAHLPQAQARNDQQAIGWVEEIQHRLNTLPSLPASLVHHDLHLGNLALDCNEANPSQSQLILLDWEYGGIGNAWFDAAALLKYLDMSSDIIYTLPSFQHLSYSTFQRGLQQAIDLIELVTKLWYRTRGE